MFKRTLKNQVAKSSCLQYSSELKLANEPDVHRKTQTNIDLMTVTKKVTLVHAVVKQF